jgi:drug/metabolite transporter (DMT)-like permease
MGKLFAAMGFLLLAGAIALPVKHRTTRRPTTESCRGTDRAQQQQQQCSQHPLALPSIDGSRRWQPQLHATLPRGRGGMVLASKEGSASVAPRKSRFSMEVAILFTFCTLLSLMTDMLTKHILSVPQVWSGLSVTVTFCHFFISAICGAFCLPALAWYKRHFGTPAPPAAEPLSWTALRALWPLGLCQAGGFFVTNLSLKLVSVSFSHTVKACECLFTALFAYVILRQKLSFFAYAALLPTVAGVALSASSEIHFQLYGFLAGLASNAFFAARSVLSSQKLRDTSVGPTTLYWLLCCFAALMLAPGVLAFGEPWRLLEPERAGLLMAIATCGVTHFSYNVLSFQILQRTSPVTHVVLHALRRVIVIAAASALARQPLGLANWVGVAVASVGVLAYAAALVA